MEKAIEILKKAILMERKGKAFYSGVAVQTNSEDVKKIFDLMASEEVLHEEILSRQYLSLQKDKVFTKLELSSCTNNDAFTKLILNHKIVSQISAASYEAAAISAAIDMESKAIEVYSEQAKAATDPNEKKLFKWLAEWEKGHHKILLELDKELKEQVWFDNQFWPF